MTMIYLASVYSYKADQELMQKRFEFVEKFVADNIKHHLISPIVYGHAMNVKFNMPPTYDFWLERDRELLDKCDEVWVLGMPHWRQSAGVTDEIDYALKTGKKIKLISTEGIYSE